MNESLAEEQNRSGDSSLATRIPWQTATLCERMSGRWNTTDNAGLADDNSKAPWQAR